VINHLESDIAPNPLIIGLQCCQ